MNIQSYFLPFYLVRIFGDEISPPGSKGFHRRIQQNTEKHPFFLCRGKNGCYL
jgi:hypothetical protein